MVAVEGLKCFFRRLDPENDKQNSFPFDFHPLLTQVSMADGPFACATLLTSDSYLPGALALVAALADVHRGAPTPPERSFTTVCLVTPETLDAASLRAVNKAYDLVIGVEPIRQFDPANLTLLGEWNFLFASIGSQN